MKLLIALLLLSATPIYPTIEHDPHGWMPVCPAGTEVVRHYPAPDCFWGKRPVTLKPTQGDFECLPLAQAQKFPACPAEQ
jgi:hypothetical protein